MIEPSEFSRQLARSHYENFSIASIILPRHLRQDIFLLYSFARQADDFADELNDAEGARAKLDEWERSLLMALNQPVDNPLLNALADVIKRHNLPPQLFLDLLQAFRMDTEVTRYNSWDDLRNYTRLSADPVGRLMLLLFGYDSQELFALSDNICTALQLANHWQDVIEDFYRGRIYIPIEDCERFGITESSFENRQFSHEFRELMKFEVGRARDLFLSGKPLLRMVKGRFALQLSLYWGGGMGALSRIERNNFDVLNKSARLTRGDKVGIGLSSLSRWLRLS